MALRFEDGVHVETVASFIRDAVSGDLDPGIRPFYRGVGKHYEQTNPSRFFELMPDAITKRFYTISYWRCIQVNLRSDATTL